MENENEIEVEAVGTDAGQAEPETDVAALAAEVRSIRESIERLGQQQQRQPLASIDGGAGSTHQPLTREALSKMTAGEISRLDWADVRRVIGSR